MSRLEPAPQKWRWFRSSGQAPPRRTGPAAVRPLSARVGPKAAAENRARGGPRTPPRTDRSRLRRGSCESRDPLLARGLDPAVAHAHGAASALGNLWVVGDQHDRLA